MRGWVGPATIIVGAQALLCAWLAAQFDIKMPPPIQRYFATGASLAFLVGAGALLAQLLRARSGGSPTPVLELRKAFSANTARIALFYVGTVLAICQFSMLTWGKVMLPETTGYWADPLLADVEATIFGGDLWRTLHFADLWWLDNLYNAWLIVILAGIVFFLARNDDRAIIAFFLTMAVGVLTIYLLPSGGPIFYERLGLGDRFAELPVSYRTRMGADYLWSVHMREEMSFGAGISAMPSMHVAMSAWLALCSTKLRLLAWSYFVIVLFGSVYLGWHYLLDGVAGGAAAYFCFRLSTVVLNVRLPTADWAREAAQCD